jgi:hypothetical protein
VIGVAPADALCCSSSRAQQIIASEGGTWTTVDGLSGVPIESIPASSEF